jgi:hypothetical protein
MGHFPSLQGEFSCFFFVFLSFKLIRQQIVYDYFTPTPTVFCNKNERKPSTILGNLAKTPSLISRPLYVLYSFKTYIKKRKFITYLNVLYVEHHKFNIAVNIRTAHMKFSFLNLFFEVCARFVY